jgi:hypothetical protein
VEYVLLSDSVTKKERIVKIYKPNMGYVHEEAERARKTSNNDKDRRDLRYFAWEAGENIIRVLPPWNAQGFIGKKTLTHFDVPPNKSLAKCLLTWPDKFDSCPIDDNLEKIQRALPTSDLSRVGAATHYQLNVIDRDDEESGVCICRVTPGIYNWIMLQMDNPKIGDITDIAEGFDLIITKNEKKRKSGSGTYTNYSCSFVPRPSPLAESDEQANEWLSQMFDLDRVFGPPREEQVAEVTSIASKMFAYYTRKYKDELDEGEVISRNETEPEEKRPVKKSTQTWDDEVPHPAETARTKPQPHKTEVVAPRDKDTPKVKKSTPAAARALADINPKGVPACFAGLEEPEAHEDGSYGFVEDLEKCILCRSELACLDNKKRKGL